jgi:hypothetical protein
MSSSNRVQHFSAALSRRHTAFLSVRKTNGVQQASATINDHGIHTRQFLRCAPNLVPLITKHDSTLYAILVDTILMKTYFDWSSVILMQRV